MERKSIWLRLMYSAALIAATLGLGPLAWAQPAGERWLLVADEAAMLVESGRFTSLLGNDVSGTLVITPGAETPFATLTLTFEHAETARLQGQTYTFPGYFSPETGFAYFNDPDGEREWAGMTLYRLDAVNIPEAYQGHWVIRDTQGAIPTRAGHIVLTDTTVEIFSELRSEVMAGFISATEPPYLLEVGPVNVTALPFDVSRDGCAIWSNLATRPEESQVAAICPSDEPPPTVAGVAGLCAEAQRMVTECVHQFCAGQETVGICPQMQAAMDAMGTPSTCTEADALTAEAALQGGCAALTEAWQTMMPAP